MTASAATWRCHHSRGQACQARAVPRVALTALRCQALAHHRHQPVVHARLQPHAALTSSSAHTRAGCSGACAVGLPPLPHPVRGLGRPGCSSRFSAATAAAATAAAVAAGPAAAAAGGAAVAPAAPAAGGLVELVAVLLGYGCLIGSCFRSVPQIAKIVKTRSAEGLSLTSNLMELLCYTVTIAYNFQQAYAFNTYGEVFACWLQDIVIVALIFKHMALSGPVMAGATVAFAAGCAWLFSPACSMQLLAQLQLSTIVVMALGARVPQIWLNIKRGNAGVLSVVTCVLNVLGCIVRTFTTLVLTGDNVLLWGCATQLALNAVLLYQAVTSPGTASAPAPASPAEGKGGEGSPGDEDTPGKEGGAALLPTYPPTVIPAPA